MSKDTAYQIEKTAIELFKDKGYKNVTIDEICQAAEITKSTFYYHFASKDRLLSSFYNYTDSYSPDILRFLATSDNCWHKLWACLEPAIDWTVMAGASILSQVYILNLQKHENTFILPNASDLEALYLGIIEKGQETLEFRNNSDPKLIYDNITNIILGIAVQWCIANGEFDEKEAIKKAVIGLLAVETDLI